MHCRTCGREVDPAAVACLTCGCPPYSGFAFCPRCGAATQVNQVVCVSCGMALTSSKPPGKVQAIGILILVGGIIATLNGLGWSLYLALMGIATFGIMCLFCFAPIYSLVIGIIAIVKGARLVGRHAGQESPPTTIAILQIVNIICCDWLNLIAGIIELVFLNDPEVRAYYARPVNPASP